jgi:catechol 2,3-dioxygenase-like lactoylglutathione lyase family enzyme
MKLYRVVIPVQNLNKAISFYSELLKIQGKRVSDGRYEFNCGGTILACYDAVADGEKVTFRPNPDHIYLGTIDIEKCYHLANSLPCLRIDETIETLASGEKCFFFVDPFGNPICIAEESTMPI